MSTEHSPGEPAPTNPVPETPHWSTPSHGRSDSEHRASTPRDMRVRTSWGPGEDQNINIACVLTKGGPLSPAPTPSETPFGPMSPTTIDRVFPLRSVVSVDPTPTPMTRGTSRDGFPGMAIGEDSTIAARGSSTRQYSTAQSTSGDNKSGSSQTRTPPIQGEVSQRDLFHLQLETLGMKSFVGYLAT